MKYKKLISIVTIVLALIACKQESYFNPLIKEKFKLDFPEPSDLALSYDGNYLWSVSDDNSTVYKIKFNGKVVKSFVVDGYDLEGVTPISDTSLAVILERERTILIVDTNGIELNRSKIDKDGDLNLGFEGITYNPTNKHFYVVNEKSPGLLIELDESFKVLKETNLNFANDYSGICYDEITKGFYIISDESALIAKCDINGNLIESYKFQLNQIEGIAVDNKNKTIYLVSDSDAEMYVFKF